MNNNKQKTLELFPESFPESIDDSLEPDRPNRLCVTLSDIHLTDGTVGFQNLEDTVWTEFYDSLAAHCKRNEIEEVTLILDGDVVDMIRSNRWAKAGIYPWQREKKEKFAQVVNQIIVEIIKQHHVFFTWLQNIKNRLPQDTKIKSGDAINIVIILGNHDKELLCDNDALTYFYENGLGKKLENFSDQERAWLGRMYGDEEMFKEMKTAPYFPFYYGDRGFRFFTTHGQWRDKSNSRKVFSSQGLPGWTAADGWQNETWQQLKFSPFLAPCFGDTIAAGLLSTFIYKAKKKLSEYKEGMKVTGDYDKDENIRHDIKRLENILDELDLYRPTYKAVVRILDEAKSMHNEALVAIIEETLFSEIISWLECDFVYESSSAMFGVFLRVAKYFLKFLKFLKLHKFIALSLVKFSLKFFDWYGLLKLFFINTFRLLSNKDVLTSNLLLKDLKGFPAFMPEYEHYGFQIHGEGHTHIPLEEEPRIRSGKPTTYVNFGTWRDQILGRKNTGYRRRGVLRLFYILDLKGKKDKYKNNEQRQFNYFTEDITKWSDKKDDLLK